MKKALFYILLVCILSACTGQQEQSSNNSLLEQEGVIVEIKENQDRWNRILVVPNINEEDISSKKNDELIELAQEKEGAYYGLEPEKFEELEVGTHVIVYWNGSQEDSDPPQRRAEKIEIISKK